jgi:hypothetical protein
VRGISLSRRHDADDQKGRPQHMCDRGVVPRRSHWERTPKQSIELECARRGQAQLVSGCVALLRRQDVDDDLMIALGGPVARAVLDSGPKPAYLYWLRVWGARGLLHAYADQAEDAVIEALRDEHWRVREMAAKVIARRRGSCTCAADRGELMTRRACGLTADARTHRPTLGALPAFRLG